MTFLKYVLFLATVDDGMKSKGSHGELVDIMCRITFTLPLKIKKISNDFITIQ